MFTTTPTTGLFVVGIAGTAGMALIRAGVGVAGAAAGAGHAASTSVSIVKMLNSSEIRFIMLLLLNRNQYSLLMDASFEGSLQHLRLLQTFAQAFAL